MLSGWGIGLDRDLVHVQGAFDFCLQAVASGGIGIDSHQLGALVRGVVAYLLSESGQGLAYQFC